MNSPTFDGQGGTLGLPARSFRVESKGGHDQRYQVPKVDPPQPRARVPAGLGFGTQLSGHTQPKRGSGPWSAGSWQGAGRAEEVIDGVPRPPIQETARGAGPASAPEARQQAAVLQVVEDQQERRIRTNEFAAP